MVTEALQLQLLPKSIITSVSIVVMEVQVSACGCVSLLADSGSYFLSESMPKTDKLMLYHDIII